MEEANNASDVVTRTFLVHGIPIRILFYSGANRSFITTRLVHVIPNSRSKLDAPLKVEVGNGKVELVVDVYRACEIKIDSEVFQANLIPFSLGMDWLSSFNAKISCDKNMVYLKTYSRKDMVIYGDRNERFVSVCTFARASRYMSHGFPAYPVHIVDTKKKSPFIEDILVVSEFSDIFPDDLPGVPPERQVMFSIDLIPGATPIAKAPYRLAPIEMQS